MEVAAAGVIEVAAEYAWFTRFLPQRVMRLVSGRSFGRVFRFFGERGFGLEDEVRFTL